MSITVASQPQCHVCSVRFLPFLEPSQRRASLPFFLFLFSLPKSPEIFKFPGSLLRFLFSSALDAVKSNGVPYSQHPSRGSSHSVYVTESVVDGLVKFIERFQIPYAKQWIQELRDGTMDAFITLLVSQLSNLECLYLGKNFSRESRLMGMMLRSALCEKAQDNPFLSFARLHDISAIYPGLGLYIRDYQDVRNITDVLPFFYLPSVKHLKTLVDNPATFI